MKKELIIFFGAIVIICCLAGCRDTKYEDEKKDYCSFFSENDVICLGNYLVAYLVDGENILETKKEDNYLIIQDLINGDKLYIPNKFEKILDISIDDAGINIKYSSDSTCEEVSVPIYFSDVEANAWEVNSVNEKIILDIQTENFLSPGVIWSEFVENEGKYIITFERTSIPYSHIYSEIYGMMADYKLTVKNENDNTIWERRVTNYPIQYEEVYWIKDISKDGYPDIIFCTDYIGQPTPNTRLDFWIWNSKKEEFELMNLPVKYMLMPIWNERLSTLMFFEEGFNHYVDDMKMYSFDEEEWKLYSEVITDTQSDEKCVFKNGFEEEKYYKELDYFWREVFYKDEQIIAENLLENAPWWDENSIWYRDNDENEPLYPERMWKREHIGLAKGKDICKYIMVKQ